SDASGSYKLQYLDMVQSSAQNRPHSGLPPSAIPLPGLSAEFTPGGFASSRAMFSGIPRDSVSGIPPPVDPPPKIPFSEPNKDFTQPAGRPAESPLYASDPLYEVPQLPQTSPAQSDLGVGDHKQIRGDTRDVFTGPSNNRSSYNDADISSPDNMLTTRTEPSGEEDHYSSIPSLMSITSETPSTLPRGSWPNRVANSSSWDSIGGSSGFSSMGSSQGLSGNTSSSKESAAARRRRRARSDPRMDSGALNRLSLSVCNSDIRIKNESHLEASD
ncbi:hypothetical protein FHG87_003876, partial [Trinorchestia longiramus]